MDAHRERQLFIDLLTCLTDADTAARTAGALLPRFGNLSALLEAVQPGEVGETALALLRMIPPLSRYRALEKLGERPLINTFLAATAYVGGLYIGAQYERVTLLCLDGEYRLISCEALIDGTLKEVSFDSRRLLQAALTCNARAVILCHNHPSGRAYFSEADVSATRDALKLLAAVDVSVLDHLLVAHGVVKSMREHLYLAEKLWMTTGHIPIPYGKWQG